VIIPKDAPAIAPAPAPEWARVHQAPVRECGQPLVPLSLAPERILVRPAYHVAGIPGALPECHAREEVQKRLWAAQALLPPFLRLVILDAWRGVRVQTALYDQCRAALARAHPGADAAALDEMTGRFVALPSVEPGRPSPHVTGGAVDLTLATVAGAPLWFGAAFDFPGPVSFTRHFEERLDAGETLDDRGRTALENRRLLHHVMTQAGFVNYHAEWWHFEYGTQRWALLTGQAEARYGVAAPDLNPFATLAEGAPVP
jgi:D-alanyl-D-alanine dipeptidase